MSPRLRRLVERHLHPGLVTALLGVALIGTWHGRTFLDDDLDLADVADFVPADRTSDVPDAGHGDEPPLSHSVAA